jgi:hypothetical protein
MSALFTHAQSCSCFQVLGCFTLLDHHLHPESTLFFSSTAAIWSQLGAAHYSASNCFLDAAAKAWQHMGLPATSLNFGPFGGTGMAASLK